MAFRGRPVTAATLMPNSVATIHIQNLAVTDAKIASLAVDKLTAGTLNAINVVVRAILSLDGTGLLRTSDPPNMRVEITAVLNDRISFFSGGADETSEGGIIVAYSPNYYGAGMGAPYVGFHAPDAADNPLGAGANTVLWLWPERAVINNPFQVPAGDAATPSLAYAGTATGLFFDALPVPLAGITIAGTERAMFSAALTRIRSTAIQANDGAGTGDVEVFPLGTYIVAADLFDSTGWAIPNAAAQVMSAAALSVEYANQPVVVLVTFEAEVTGMTAGEYVYLRPTVNGNVLGGGLIREDEPSAAGSIAALVHAAGAAPGLGHSATGSHTHDVTGRAVYNTSGPASAGTAHTHTAGNYNTALVAALATSSGSHSAHGTHTIADHAAVAAHSHPKTYDFVVVRSGVYVGNASAGGQITLGVYGRTQTNPAVCGRVAFHFLILRG